MTTEITKVTAKDIKNALRYEEKGALEINGLTFELTLERDDDIGPPWEESDGRGPVSKWTSRDKRAGEWTLHSDHGSKRFYDAQEAQKTALRDGWGLNPEEKAKLTAKLGREPSKREIAAEAVKRDFEYLQGWCRDEWHWLFYVVELNGETVDSCGGIDDADYAFSLMADAVNQALEDAGKEAIERAFWEARDVETV